jgi:hypothetical protein
MHDIQLGFCINAAVARAPRSVAQELCLAAPMDSNFRYTASTFGT